MIYPASGADALGVATAHDTGLALGQPMHWRIPKGTTLWHVDDWSNVHLNFNPLLPPMPYGNFARAMGDVDVPTFGRSLRSVGYSAICMDDPADISMVRTGPLGGYPYGYGPMGPVGNILSFCGLEIGSPMGQYVAGGHPVPFNGDLFTRGSFLHGGSSWIET